MKYIKIVIKYLLVATMMFSPALALAEMRSNNYVINENVNHIFDGPIISNVSHTVSGVSVAVSFNTNISASGFVVYSVNSDFSNSMEQGRGAKNRIDHSISLKGLSANTVYYYKVRSESIGGGETVDATLRSFTTGVDPSLVPAVAQSGGVIVIDKTDKTAPVISNVQIKIIDEESLEMSWITDEEATSFGEYGETSQYGNIDGQWNNTKNHIVILKNLKPEFRYHIRPISSDSWGNIEYGENIIFNTIAGKISQDIVLPEVATTTENQENISQSILAEASRKMLEFVNRLFPQASLNSVTNISEIKTIEQLSRFMPVPILSGEPRLEIGSDNATVFWTTDIDSTSQVAISPDDKYQSRVGELYVQVVGDVQPLNKSHEVKIFGLKPNTVYHYQLRSKGNFGPMAFSRDFTFKTFNEEIKIISFLTQVKDAQTAVIKWVTNKQADSVVEFAPYRNNAVALDELKTIRNNELELIHEIEIKEFMAGVYYNIEIISIDQNGNASRQKMDRFSTQENDLPPEISHIKTDSTVYLDKNGKTQTVVSWTTNEPTNGQIFYQEGVHNSGGILNSSTEINMNFTKEHVFVITDFKPGIVYSFQVKAIDSGGNEALSKVHTFMTAKNKESIIQIIIKILEDTFGWVKKLI